MLELAQLCAFKHTMKMKIATAVLDHSSDTVGSIRTRRISQLQCGAAFVDGIALQLLRILWGVALFEAECFRMLRFQFEQTSRDTYASHGTHTILSHYAQLRREEQSCAQMCKIVHFLHAH